MPAGLDGHPDPIRTPERDALLVRLSELVLAIDRPRVVVGIDGRSGSGKSTLADELAQVVSPHRHVVRSTTDSFHRPRAERMRAGPTSARGYYEDSHQLDRIRDEALTPFAAGAPRVRVAAFDEPSDQALVRDAEVPAESMLIFDGLFLHRPELVGHWHLSVYLHADRRLDAGWLQFLLGDLADDPTTRATQLDERLHRARWPRYRDGWSHYVQQVDPRSLATVVVDNDDLAHPRII